MIFSFLGHKFQRHPLCIENRSLAVELHLLPPPLYPHDLVFSTHQSLQERVFYVLQQAKKRLKYEHHFQPLVVLLRQEFETKAQYQHQNQYPQML